MSNTLNTFATSKNGLALVLMILQVTYKDCLEKGSTGGSNPEAKP